jgi:hypothetical protein
MPQYNSNWTWMSDCNWRSHVLLFQQEGRAVDKICLGQGCMCVTTVASGGKKWNEKKKSPKRNETQKKTEQIHVQTKIVDLISNMLERQGRSEASLGLIENIWLNITFQIDHFLAQWLPSPGPELINHWMGITWFLPSPRSA